MGARLEDVSLTLLVRAMWRRPNANARSERECVFRFLDSATIRSACGLQGRLDDQDHAASTKNSSRVRVRRRVRVRPVDRWTGGGAFNYCGGVSGQGTEKVGYDACGPPPPTAPASYRTGAQFTGTTSTGQVALRATASQVSPSPRVVSTIKSESISFAAATISSATLPCRIA